jgi:hypothetical protein
VDDRVSAIDERGPSKYFDGSSVPLVDFVDGKTVHRRVMLTSYNTMYILAVMADYENPPWDVYSLPDPLRSSLLRSRVSSGISALNPLQTRSK